jgi:hypothetical protein
MRIQTAENQTAGLTVRRRNPSPDRDTARSWPEQIFQKLREADIRQVTYVPDAGHARLIELCHAEPVMKTTVLTTEEGIGVLSGAWLGGERGVLLMQSSGVAGSLRTRFTYLGLRGSGRPSAEFLSVGRDGQRRDGRAWACVGAAEAPRAGGDR